MRRIVVIRTGAEPPVETPTAGVSAWWLLPGIVLFFAFVVLVVTWLAGRGEGDDPASTTTPAAEPVLEAPVEPAVPEPPEGSFTVSAGENTSLDLDELADAIERRLSAAGHTGALVTVEGTVLQVDPGPGPLTVAAMQELLREPGRLEIRPVRRERRPAACADQPAAQGADDDVSYPEYEFTGQRTGEIVACYQLAPGGITNAAIERAHATVIPPDVEAAELLVGHPRGHEHDPVEGDAGETGVARRLAVLAGGRHLVEGVDAVGAEDQVDGPVVVAVAEETANSMVAALITAPLPRGLEFSE